jgi:hypothetical protein
MTYHPTSAQRRNRRIADRVSTIRTELRQQIAVLIRAAATDLTDNYTLVLTVRALTETRLDGEFAMASRELREQAAAVRAAKMADRAAYLMELLADAYARAAKEIDSL